MTLADWIFAPHYARAEAQTVIAESVMLRTAPRADAVAGTQLLFGEDFHVLDAAGGWAWGFCGHDHYVGYVPSDALGSVVAPTHVVSAREAPVFADASIKAAATMTLSIGARLAGAMAGDFLETSHGYVHCRHVAPLGSYHGDSVNIAETLIGAPYLWGGRGAGGIDCSGLVQLALALTGHECPRDSDQQRAALGDELAPQTEYRRGDLVFFPGHVGFMTDAETLLHANAWWMAVTREPLRDVVARLQADHAQPILSARRFPS